MKHEEREHEARKQTKCETIDSVFVTTSTPFPFPLGQRTCVRVRGRTLIHLCVCLYLLAYDLFYKVSRFPSFYKVNRSDCGVRQIEICLCTKKSIKPESIMVS